MGHGTDLPTETRLDSHDIEIPFTQAANSGQAVYRFLCLALCDIGLEQTNQRVDRLVHLDGTGNAAVIFLLGGDGDDEATDRAMTALMRLQIE